VTSLTRPRRRPNRQGLVGYLFLAPFVAVFTFVIVLPLLFAIYTSLFRNRMVGGRTFVALGNYARALADPLLLDGLVRVGTFFLIQVPVMITLALIIALALDSGRLWGGRAVRLGVFLPYAIPAVVASLMWGYLYGDQFGLVGQIADALGVVAPDVLSANLMLPAIGNIVTWQFTGYNMLIFYAALKSIPDEQLEAAAIDGASRVRQAWSIKLPALRPAILLVTIFSIIGSFQLFNEPNVLRTMAPAVIVTSYTPNIYAYNLAFSGRQFDYAAAVSVILALATMIVAYIVQLVSARSERTR
jgi:multiple sugar transport system permease protein